MFAIESLILKIALIGVLGIGAQWIAWRINRPAIALMLLAGILAGPVLGLINPERDFGELLEPMVKLAVAVILFEGGLSLNFKDLRHAGSGVLRLVIFGVPIGWALGTAAVHYGAGLSLGVSALFGGVLVVTGPTVIGPMLRSLRVGSRVRDILKWEGIVNDPIGALLAVGIFAAIQYGQTHGNVDVAEVAFNVLGATYLAGLIGAILGWGLTWLFPRGFVPEFLKAPVLFITVIGGFVGADIIMHESGLVTVTVMGLVMANRPMFSSKTLRRFKEDLTVLLISGVFILLAATLDWETMQKFQGRFLIFLLLLLFVVRPITVLVSLLFTKIPWKERLFIAWIAPRGIVAIAVTSLFAIRLGDLGYEGADALVPLVFAVVIVTIIAHGFSAGIVAKWLDIDQGPGRSILIVGSNRWSVALASMLKKLGLEVTVADQSRAALRFAKRAQLPTHFGDVAEEAHGHGIDLGSYQQLLAITDNDAENRLIASDLGPEMGFEQIGMISGDSDDRRYEGRSRILLQSGRDLDEMEALVRDGWIFSCTNITEKFGWKEFQANLEEHEEAIAVLKPDQRLLLFTTDASPSAEPDDIIISFVQPDTPEERKAARDAKQAEDDQKKS
ncbi:MAG: sodium:proton antiporter [Sphingorhabdus sp.]